MVISGGITRVTEVGTAAGSAERRLFQDWFVLTINDIGQMISMVLMEKLKLGQILTVEMLPLDRGTTVQLPKSLLQLLLKWHTQFQPPVSQKDTQDLEQSAERY